MRILLVSDTHGRDRNFWQVYEQVKPVDMILHMGDIEGSEERMEAQTDCPFYAVAGNNDFFTALPKDRELKVGSHSIFMTHGHGYRVALGNEYLAREAAKRGCTIALYGHTHMPEIETVLGVTCVNPGSLSLPRQFDRRPSYILMEIDEEDQVHYAIRYLDE
jgi:hypothetical protein